VGKGKKWRSLTHLSYLVGQMLDSSLVETLSCFQPAELESFHKYVASPYFNDGPYARDVTALWEYLRPHAPAFEHADLSVQQAHAVLFPQKAFVKGKIEVLMSKLHQLAKQFAAQRAEMSFSLPESLRLAIFFLDRGLPQRAQPLLEKLHEEQAQRPVHDLAYWAERFSTEWQTHRLDTIRQNNHAHESLHETLHALHHGYLLLALDLLNSLLFTSRKSRVDIAFAEAVAEGIPAAAAIADLPNEPLLRLLKRGFDFARAPEAQGHAALQSFLDELDAHATALPPDMLRTLNTYLRNHCTWHYNHGETAYAPLLLSLFQTALARGFLFENGKIQAATLLNLVQTGLVNQAFDWVKDVLQQCRDHIVGVPNPEEFYRYNLANYYYHLQEHDRALDLLLDSSDNLFSTLMARKLELKIYYETQSPLLESKMDSFKLFIFRQGKKSLAENVFLMNNAFIDLLRQMMASTNVNNPGRLAKLRQKLDDTQLVAERAWLQAQLDKMGR
jgi:hypothetical protein